MMQYFMEIYVEGDIWRVTRATVALVVLYIVFGTLANTVARNFAAIICAIKDNDHADQ